MSNKAPDPKLKAADLGPLGTRLRKAIFNNWGLKLVSLLISLTIWGALISEDASLTREKLFNDVPVAVVGADQLQRNGLIVTGGIKNLEPIKMRADVPQRAFDSALPSSYQVRVDLSRISSTGTQKLPILTSTSPTYGAVSWLSQSEITVQVDEYITRRRVPVRLEETGALPPGYYAAGAAVDPATVVISGPRSLIEQVARVVASYHLEQLGDGAGVQYTAVPFRLVTSDNRTIESDLISVTSENVLLDTLLVEQAVYPMKTVGINLSGILSGLPAEGFRVGRMTADPEQIEVAGNIQDIGDLEQLDLTSSIDVSGKSETLIRAMMVDRPLNTVYVSENLVYVTVEIIPADQNSTQAP